MNRARIQWLALSFFVFWSSAPLRAQSTITAFLPEIDSYIRLSSNVRLMTQAKGYMEDGDLDHGQVGPGLEFSFRPLEKLQEITVFDLDDIKCQPVVLTIGYRYLPSSVQPNINRLQPIVLLHVPFPGKTLVTDRNRFDLDWSKRAFNWTYRNRVTAERRVTIRSYHPGPYIAGEATYQSEFGKWSITRLFAGCLWPLTKNVQLDTYYEHVNNTGPRPNRQVNASGLSLDLFFPPYKP